MTPCPAPRSRFCNPSTVTRRAVARALVLLVGIVAPLLLTTSPASAGQVGVTVQVQGSGVVQVVEGSLEDGASGVCDWTSNKDERVTNTCARFRNAEAFEAWVWLRATPSTVPSGHWRLAGWTGCDTTRTVDGHVECAVHSGVFDAVERSPRAVFVDDLPPTVSAVTPIFSTAVERRVTFFFSTDEGQPQCRFDAEVTFANCTSGVARDFTEGWHTLNVRAIDQSGQVGLTVSETVKVLDTAITGGPAQGSLTSSRSPTFTYSTVAGTAFECSLDGMAFAACPSGGKAYTGLGDGQHTFRVRAVDGEWSDRVPALRTWTIDGTPPATTLTSTTVDGDTASFSFTSSEAGTFQCRLTTDGAVGGWETCPSPTQYVDLADADHTFEVRAVDAAGNADLTPASHGWTVDTTAPVTRILSGPAQGSFVLSPNATFGYGSDETGSTFTCTVDDAEVPCPGNQLSLADLSHRTHWFEVAATDAALNSDPTPAQRTWTVPLDDPELSASRHWSRRTDSRTYLGTYSQASRTGATLKEGVSGAWRIALVVTKAPGAGTVRVHAGTRLLGTVKLDAASTKRKQVVPMERFSTPFTGTVKVVVVSSGKAVRIDGLGVATQ